MCDIIQIGCDQGPREVTHQGEEGRRTHIQGDQDTQISTSSQCRSAVRDNRDRGGSVSGDGIRLEWGAI